MCCGALVGMGVFYRIAGYLVLWRTYGQSRTPPGCNV